MRYLSITMLLAIYSLFYSFPANAIDDCLILADSQGQALHRQGDCASQLPPASTFKIPLALMGYDSGFLSNDELPALPFKSSDDGWLAAWRETTTPRRWMTYSVVWYSQRLTEWLGMTRLQHYVDRFDYGNRDLSGNRGKNDGLTQAWLSSSLTISPDEQVRFLSKMLNNQLKIAAQSQQQTAAILHIKELDGWQIHGKTGMGYLKNEDGTLNRNQQVGWFVGWASRQESTMIFVRTVIQPPGKTYASIKAKEEMLAELPALLTKS